MHRRNLVTLLGGVILAPLALRAQQKAVRVIGVLDTKGTNSNPDPELLSGMSIGLAETGYTDGQNVVVKSVSDYMSTAQVGFFKDGTKPLPPVIRGEGRP